jgi:hypothetical protein
MEMANLTPRILEALQSFLVAPGVGRSGLSGGRGRMGFGAILSCGPGVCQIVPTRPRRTPPRGSSSRASYAAAGLAS